VVAGKLVILSGPSGVGKDAVIARWIELHPNVSRVVAYTTRAARVGEKNGLDYNFISIEEFKMKAGNGDFLESKEVYGNYYATPLADMEAMLAEGKTAVLKIDVQGAMSAMNLRTDAITIFLLPPNQAELIRRIRTRGTERGDALEKRIENAQFEIAQANRYQYRVVNENIDQAVAELEEITSGN
jgi:guanylate kinase